MSPSEVRRTMLTSLAWSMVRVEKGTLPETTIQSIQQEVTALRWLLEKAGLLDEVRLEACLARAREKQARTA